MTTRQSMRPAPRPSRSYLCQVRLYGYERDRWVDGAARLGISVADLVRDAVAEKLCRVETRQERGDVLR
jgi:hypothetical protein